MIRYRKKGLPKRLRRIPGGVPGLVSACNIHLHGETPTVKVAVFKNKASMRHFYSKILPKYRGWDGPVSDLGRRCLGCVNQLQVTHFSPDNQIEASELDRNYCCIVLLVEGHLTAEVLAHEAVHVAFAWDQWHQGKNPFEDPHNYEEAICYPAGIFVDQVLTFIKREKLREV